jgi:DNA polymerase-3 subunit alpha
MSLSNADFVHLHAHSEFSRFDGLNKIGEWVMSARRMGFKSLALTDHGNVGGWIKFYQECKRKKDKKEQEILFDPIKPIFGQEFYLCKDHRARGNEEQPDGRKGNRHLLLIAKNWEGYQNLCTLSQLGFTEGQAFGDARIDLRQLAEHSKGLICNSACLSSVVNSNLLAGRYEQAKKAVAVFIDIFGKDNFNLEVMYHGIDAEGAIAPLIIKLGKEMGVKVIATNDCHYCKQEQAKSQELLMAMSMSRCLKDPKAYHFPYDEFYMKSAAEMAKIFGTEPRLLSNTVLVSEMVEDFLKPGGMRLPVFNIPAARKEIELADQGIEYGLAEKMLDEIYNGQMGESIGKIKSDDDVFKEAFSLMEELAHKGMKKLNWDESPEHVAALAKELSDVKVAWNANHMDFATYFLIVWNYINFARRKGIITGCGRGSGYASVLLRTLGICYGPCPIRYGLLWERFLGFDSKFFLLDSDWGFDEEEKSTVTVDDILASDDIDDERVVEDDQGGVDRY